ncbi:MAG: FliA/WhiG family RNA polymerase sigma factor [Nitrospiria bacterium]
MSEKEQVSKTGLADTGKVVEDFTELIRFMAQRFAYRLPPYLDVEDLIHAGVIGLINAMGKYDPSRETLFKTYAEFRIRGAMLDEIRSMDWIPRSVHEKIKLLQKALGSLEKKLGRAPTEEEVIEELKMNQDQFEAFLFQARPAVLLSFEDLGFKEGSERSALETLADPRAEDPLAALLSHDVRERLIDNIEQLPERERLVVALYYQEELTMKEIGQILQLTESRICQLHTQAVLRLKGKLGGDMGDG